MKPCLKRNLTLNMKTKQKAMEQEKEGLMPLLRKCNTSEEIVLLAKRFPAILHVQTPSKDLVLHRIAKFGILSDVTTIVFQGICENVCGSKGCGGLFHKNIGGVTPMALLSAKVCYKGCSKKEKDGERQLMHLIQKVALHYVHVDNPAKKNMEQTSSPETPSIPILHAALMINCPANIINIALKGYCTIDTFSFEYLGRTPLQLAALSNLIDANSLLLILRRNPAMAAKRSSVSGEYVLHEAIKAGPNRIFLGKYLGEVDFIGKIVQEWPESLEIHDEVLDLPPFVLAAQAGWSIKLIYGLLRANPFAIDPFTQYSRYQIVKNKSFA